MTVASSVGVMVTVFKIRWALTLYLLEFAIRVLLLGAFFGRAAVRREPIRKVGP